jgi:hypothetical protein
MSAEVHVPPRVSAFSVIVFATAIVIGAAVTWLGITGHIGGPIP